MTVSQEFLITTILLFGAGIIGAFSAIMRVMWVHLNTRLRTLGHEDRDIRSQINNVMGLLMENLKDADSIESLRDENARLSWMVKTISGKDTPPDYNAKK